MSPDASFCPTPTMSAAPAALAYLGFKALASTSAGFAWTIGKADNRVTVDEVCDRLTAIQRGGRSSVNADFEGGFAVEPEKVGVNVARGVKTGVAGLSIEDSTGDAAKPLYEFRLAVGALIRRRARQSMPTTAACCSPAAAKPFCRGNPISTW